MKQCECATKVKAKAATIEMKRARSLSLSFLVSLCLAVSVSLSNVDSKWQLSSADGVAQKCCLTLCGLRGHVDASRIEQELNETKLELKPVLPGMLWNFVKHARCCVRFPVVLATRSSRVSERERVSERAVVLFRFHSFRWHWKAVWQAANYGSACAVSLSHST